MKTLTQSTQSQKEKNIVRNWHVVDLSTQVLGRVTTQISTYLQGKHKPSYAPYLDMGDYVVVINAKKISLSGKKSQTKEYGNYSGYPGGLKTTPFAAVMKKNPAEVVRHAVSGMLPKNKLRDRRMTRLYIFNEAKHPYEDKVAASK